MVRREQQRKRAESRAQKSVDRTVAEQHHGSYRPPPRGDCVEKEFVQPLDDAYTLRIDTRLWRREGRLVDFVLLLQAPDWEGWTTLSRVDCCWGFCHLHPPGDDNAGRHEPIMRLDTVDDVESAHEIAYDRLSRLGYTIRDRRGHD
ncbi:DUF7718 family protein [Herbiconiux daphne]|uniref:DUF7718 domain-containing protein n=1 Tax=Herbiconiux daphne TaxID=2970914 RepID=A0ABT2GWR2_9MICO|nr:hypothetical protein [Herbiconiux daphne]MCS5732393.1 hypothetical protein [Herbiconiux daphne]